MPPLTLFFILTGSIFVLIGASVSGFFGQIFASIINKILTLKPDAKILTTFKAPPFDVHLDFYLFNVTNYWQVRFYGAKPIVQEHGPYSYHETIKRNNFAWDNKRGEVTYDEVRSYHFDPSKSIGRETDKICQLDAVIVLAGALLFENDLAANFLWPQMESTMDLFKCRTVDELLFSGWELPRFDFDFTEINKIFNLDIPVNVSGTIYEILQQLKKSPPEMLKENKFGYYHWNNGTKYGTFTVNSGSSDMNDYLKVKKFNNMTELSYWNDKYCNMINGTDGTQFPPKMDKDQTLRIFAKDLCRSIYLKHEQDLSLYDVLETYRFVAPREMLESASSNLDNECFCFLVPGDKECLKDSMINAAPCFKGAPIILSTPHFYQGDEEDIGKLVGLNPNKKDHETFVDVEPNTGVVVNAAKRIQFNLPLKRYGDLQSFMQVPELVFPVFWANENAKISHDEAVMLASTLTSPFKIAYAVCGVLLFAGVILASIGGVRYSRHYKATRN